MHRNTNPGTPSPPQVALTDEQIVRLEAENGLRQFDAAMKIIEDSVKAGGKFTLRPSLICEMNRLAVENLEPTPGIYRSHGVSIDNSLHLPPKAPEVPALVEQLCDYVNENVGKREPLHLAAFILWRLNWIHPFSNGNGRTSRIVSYIVLSITSGFVIPGTTTIPEQIAVDKRPYYAGLDAADAAWKAGNIDVSRLETMLSEMLAEQLLTIHNAASTPSEPKGPNGQA